MARKTDERLEELTEEIKTLAKRVAALRGEKDALSEARSLHEEVLHLKETIEDLKIKELRLKEEQDKEKRETRHMVGLERKRQEFEFEQKEQEIDQARREAMLEVREENLAAEREAFEKNMEFMTNQLNAQIADTKDILSQVLERLPNVTAHFEPAAVGGSNGSDG